MTIPTLRWAVALTCLLLGFYRTASAQFVVSDPLHTGVTQLIKLLQDPSFKTMVKNIEKLKKVTSGIQQFHRGTQLIQSITQTTSTMRQMATVVRKDGHIYPAEYALITQDFNSLVNEGTSILKDMRGATSQGLFEMNDSERMTWLNKAYDRTAKLQRAVNAYYGQIRAMSLRRSGSVKDMTATAKLYAVVTQPNLAGEKGGDPSFLLGESGYDDSYDNSDKSVLDGYNKGPEAEKARQEIQDYNDRLQNYYDELQVAEQQANKQALLTMMRQGYVPIDNFWGTKVVGWRAPDGREISTDEFDVQVKILGREYLKPMRAALAKKWRINEGIGG
jgi:hypothetical protein